MSAPQPRPFRNAAAPYIDRIEQFLFQNPHFTVQLKFEPAGFRCHLNLKEFQWEGYSVHGMGRAVQRCFSNFRDNPEKSVPSGRTESVWNSRKRGPYKKKASNI